MKQTTFWLIAVIIALLTTWIYLSICMNNQQSVYDHLDNHSEITSIEKSK
ncbi:hypothetical protein J3L18_23090 [Mucilaginibacter gossypii]|nr:MULTISPECIES: hypothetical protein [Mucilaginibacter]QTE36001.1 hypothetical protein J3L18_23090 [Mucilaginibacter gossypii]